MKQNVKVIARLVRKAKKELERGKRKEALELMKKAVSVDDNNGLVIQIIQAIGRKKTPESMTEYIPESQQQKPGTEEPYEQPQVLNGEKERKASMASDDQLKKLYDASDRAFDGGHQQKAVAYLKRARKLDPENPEVESRLDSLRIKIKSTNLISIARKKLAAGDVQKAVELVRQVFDIMPESNGLHELLEDIERNPGKIASSTEDENPGPERQESNKPYIIEIRELIQKNSLEEAAFIAERYFEKNPDDALLTEFVENFKKLGLIE